MWDEATKVSVRHFHSHNALSRTHSRKQKEDKTNHMHNIQICTQVANIKIVSKISYSINTDILFVFFVYLLFFLKSMFQFSFT